MATEILFFPVTNPSGDYHGFRRPMGWAEKRALADAVNPFVRCKSDDEYVTQERSFPVLYRRFYWGGTMSLGRWPSTEGEL